MQLSAEHLTIERGGRLVIADLSFAVPAGGVLLVTGPNGTGKSTLLRTIAGLVRATAGTIHLHGGDPERGPHEQCHYFGHSDAIKSALTVRENLAFWQNFYGLAQDTLVEALWEVGLDRVIDLPAAYLSAGQRRRLSFARLLVTFRPVWLLDEPTAALDAWAEERFVQLMNAHLQRDGIIIAATHAPLPLVAGEDAPAPIRLNLAPQEETIA